MRVVKQLCISSLTDGMSLVSDQWSAELFSHYAASDY
jgi:hypothetical protein